MNLKTSPFSILNKERREIEYIKGVYKRRVQAEIDSYKNSDDEDETDTIQSQDVLMIDRISIQLFNYNHFNQQNRSYLLKLISSQITLNKIQIKGKIYEWRF